MSFDYDNEAALEAYVPEGEIAIDIGCNVGQWARFLSGRFKTVHGIDPQPDCIEAVQAIPNVIGHKVAAWSNIGRLMFRQNINVAGEWQGAIVGTDAFIVAKSEAGHFEVDCCPVDILSIPGKIDFVKVDVDGAEVQALLGCQEILKRHHPTLIIEAHNDENRAFLMVWLVKLGYSPTILLEPRIVDANRWTDEVNYIYAH
jgi:FkbM family methyltransferase